MRGSTLGGLIYIFIPDDRITCYRKIKLRRKSKSLFTIQHPFFFLPSLEPLIGRPALVFLGYIFSIFPKICDDNISESAIRDGIGLYGALRKGAAERRRIKTKMSPGFGLFARRLLAAERAIILLSLTSNNNKDPFSSSPMPSISFHFTFYYIFLMPACVIQI